MQSPRCPLPASLVLLGGGHAHLGVLRGFGLRPMPGVRLTMISRAAYSVYSAMVPGWVAGHYPLEALCFDLERLCRSAGAQFCQDEAIGLDPAARQILCRSGRSFHYDRLSIDIGSEAHFEAVPGAAGNVLPLKPIDGWLHRWDTLRERVMAHDGPVRIGVVGAGAAGVEVLLAIQHRLCELHAAAGRSAERLRYHLFADSLNLLPNHNPRTQRIFTRLLAARAVEVHTARAVVEVGAGRVKLQDGEEFRLEEILWASGPVPARWLARSGLALDDRGFIEVRDTLQSPSHPQVFAAGDIAAMLAHPRPKSGVFAVRAAAPLERNLRRSLQGLPLKPFRPQRKFLSLISTGNRYAVASRGGWALEGASVWRWKDWIDRRFMRTFGAWDTTGNARARDGEPAG